MTNLDTLANAALEADIALKEAKERADEAKAVLIEALTEAGKFDPSTKALGHTRLKITPNRFFNQAKAEALVTKKVLKECEVTKVDAALLKKHLTPIQMDSVMDSYATPFKVGLDVLTD